MWLTVEMGTLSSGSSQVLVDLGHLEAIIFLPSCTMLMQGINKRRNWVWDIWELYLLLSFL